MAKAQSNLVPPPDEAEPVTLSEDLRQLAQDARVLAEAEFAFQKTRAAYASAEAKGIALLGVVALVLLFFAVMALVVGAVIALGPVLGPWGAMLAVTGTLVLVSALCALSARTRLRNMLTAISDNRG